MVLKLVTLFSHLIAINHVHLVIFFTGRNKFFGEQNQPSPSQPISITVSDVKMPSDNNQATAVPATRTPDRLCPSNYHSYRRHSSPSALGESAAFEFPESTTDTPQSPEEDSPTPIRHGSIRNHSSPFLTRGNIRTRAQSSSSDFVSVGIGKNKAYVETNSLLTSSADEDIFGDLKFELQAPPKQRSKRSRTFTSSASLTQPNDAISDTTHTNRAPSGLVQTHEDKSRRTTTSVVDNDFSFHGDEVFYQKAKDRRRRSSPSGHRERIPDTPPVSCLGIITNTSSQSPEITHSNRRPKFTV